MSFSPQFLDSLRDRVSLGDLVARRVKLARAGRELKGLCPFHREKTPSFHVVEDKGFYHCFGCGAHGDAITWLMETEGLSFPEAVAELAGRAGMALPAPDPDARRKDAAKASLHDVMEAATRHFEAQLGRAVGRAARSYLEERGLGPDTIRSFRLGYAPDAGGGLEAALKVQGITPEQLLAAGLVRRRDDGSLYAYFRDRIIFPITDRRGRVVAFGGRALDPDTPAKYLNSPETDLFRKGHLLYNLATARRAALAAGTVILVEGYMDVIALAEAGIAHAVAPLGTALTPEQLTELWRLAPEPVLCFDGDAAGLKAAARACERALPLLAPGQSLRFALLPEGLDPDDLVRREGAAALETILAGALPLVDMLWRLLVETGDATTPERRAGVEKRALAMIATIADSRVREFYQREFRERFFHSFRARSRPVRARRGAGAPASSGLRNTALARRSDREPTRQHEQLLILHMLNHPELAESHLEELAAVTFTDSALDKLRQDLLLTLGSAQDLDREALRTHLAKNGFEGMLARLERAPILQPTSSARPEAALHEAEIGWRHVMARLRRMAIEREIAAAEAAYRETQDDETLLRLIQLKREFDRAEGTEAEVGDAGFGSA